MGAAKAIDDGFEMLPPSHGDAAQDLERRASASPEKHVEKIASHESWQEVCIPDLKEESIRPSPTPEHDKSPAWEEGPGVFGHPDELPGEDSDRDCPPGYWTWDVGRQKFIHWDSVRGKTIVCPDDWD